MQNNVLAKGSPLRFVVVFLLLFLFFYYFNIAFFGITSPGNHYSPFLDKYLNYIVWLRWALLHASATIINWFGFTSLVSNYELLAVGHGKIVLIYSCLGLGIMSFFTAFIIAYPKPLKAKILFLLAGLAGIQLLNIIRLTLLALYWNSNKIKFIDHHTIFNIVIYILISLSLYFWITRNTQEHNAAN